MGISWHTIVLKLPLCNLNLHTGCYIIIAWRSPRNIVWSKSRLKKIYITRTVWILRWYVLFIQFSVFHMMLKRMKTEWCIIYILSRLFTSAPKALHVENHETLCYINFYLIMAHKNYSLRALISVMTSWNGKHFPRYWSFMRGIHQPPMNLPHKGQWHGVLIFSWYVLKSTVE